MTLACGGKGPCCHVGYPHRHCEHCDVVIATSYCHHSYGWPYYWNTQSVGVPYGNSGSLQALSQQLSLPRPTPTGMDATPAGAGPR